MGEGRGTRGFFFYFFIFYFIFVFFVFIFLYFFPFSFSFFHLPSFSLPLSSSLLISFLLCLSSTFSPSLTPSLSPLGQVGESARAGHRAGKVLTPTLQLVRWSIRSVCPAARHTRGTETKGREPSDHHSCCSPSLPLSLSVPGLPSSRDPSPAFIWSVLRMGDGGGGLEEGG